jgi:hypothetical protein
MKRLRIRPNIPQKSTLCWYFLGILKEEKMMAMTNMLSTLKDNSIKYPVRYFMDAVSGFSPSGFSI